MDDKNTLSSITDWLNSKAKTDDDMYYVGLIAGTFLAVERHKAEIERLTEENAVYLKEARRITELDVEVRKQNAELQKQVDELLRDKGFLIADLTNARQAVKDTAKEIFTAIVEEFVFSFRTKNEDYQNGYDQALTDYDNNLKKFFKERYGVEVE